MHNKIEIPFSKIKPSFLVIVGVALIFGGIGMISHPYSNYILYRGLDPLIFYFFGVASILLGLGGIASAIKILFSKKIGLILDSRGITDNSSNMSVGLIEWADIVEIKMGQVDYLKFLYIYVKDPEKYIQKKKFSRFMMRLNMNMTGTPLYISSISLKCSFKELERIVYSEFEKYKNIS